MKKSLAALLLTALFSLSLPAAARAQVPGDGGFQSGEQLANQALGGYTGGGSRLLTVAEALQLPDEAWVSLAGKIEKRLGDEKYLFSDASGSITVEIDDDDWRGLSIGPEDTVVIQGEVDREFSRREIEVKSIALRNF